MGVEMHRLVVRSRTLALVVAAALGGAVAGGVAIAQTVGPPAITSCVHKETGAVRIVSSGTDCRPTESVVSWNKEGPVGPAGSEGPEGPQGPPGATGPEGPAGAGIGTFDDVAGLPCNVGTPAEGVIAISYAADAVGTVALTCTPRSINLLTVTRAGDGGGSVTSNPSGISCGLDCSQHYTAGTVVTLTASANSQSVFTGWTGPCSGTGTCSVTMEAATSVTATFSAVRILTVEVRSETRTFAGSGAGTVTGTGNLSCSVSGGVTRICSVRLAPGTQATLIATPNAGDEFGGWGGVCAGFTGHQCTLIMDTNKSVTASFEP